MRLALAVLATTLTGCFGGAGSETELRVYAPNVLNLHVDGSVPCKGPTNAVLKATVTGLKPVTLVLVGVAGQPGQVAMRRADGPDGKRFELPMGELPSVRALDCAQKSAIELTVTASDLDGWTTRTDALPVNFVPTAAIAH